MNHEMEAVLAPFERERDYMDERVREGVARNRMGYGALRVVDAAGNAVPGARIEARQRRHDFGLGANLFLLDFYDDPERAAAYRRLFAGAFNLATLPFYWGDLEPEDGRPRFAKDSPRVSRRPAPDLCLEFCRDNGVTPKGHCLVYEPFRPKWLQTEDVPAIKRRYERRIREIGERYRDRIPAWEVVNETMYTGHPFGYTAFFRADDHIEWSFECARRHLPGNELIINDGTDKIFREFCGNRSQYYLIVERLLREGVPVNGIGMQYHIWGERAGYAERAATYYDPKRLYAVMDCYGKLGLPLQITEITLPCYDGGEAMEDLQAEIVKNLYSIWFSHGAMEAVVYWNLVDGGAFGGENALRAGLIREDMTEKPAYRALRELFQKTWRTSADLTSGDDGRARLHAFYGDYDVTVRANGRAQTFNLAWRRDGLRDITLTLDERKD